jgi:hypothetical protein
MQPSRAAHRLAAFLKTALVFALVGPPVGWLVYAIGLFAYLQRDQASLDDAAKSGAFFIVGLPLRYIIGGAAALFTGVLAGAARASAPAAGRLSDFGRRGGGIGLWLSVRPQRNFGRNHAGLAI